MKSLPALVWFFLLSGLFLLQCQTEQRNVVPMSWQEGEEQQFPARVEGSFLQFANYCQIVLAGRGKGNEGLLCLLISKEEDLLGSHSLSNNRNKLGIPYEKTSIKQNVMQGKMLEVYVSEACRPASGKIVITDYDAAQHKISGYFEAKLCTTGRLGRLDEKLIQRGAFHEVALQYFDRRK